MVENNKNNSDFSIGSDIIEQEWNHKGCQFCRENKRYGHIIDKKCEVQYKNECIVLTMNKALRHSGFNHFSLFYQLMNQVIEPLFPEFTFHWEARSDGRFYLTNDKGDLIVFYWSKDFYDCYYIGSAYFKY